MRKASYAGLFYPRTEHSVRTLIKECFTSKLGPGALPSRASVPLVGVISPHAGYAFSGMAAAWSYKAIAESPMPDLYIVLGPNHHSSRSAVGFDGFETPLGVVRVDQTFAKLLSSKGTFRLDDSAHEGEHSIEVQLPFLQFALGSKAHSAKIVPILVSHDIDLSKAARDIKESLAESKKSAVFIVSSDFTHHGPAYGYAPFAEDKKVKLSELDGAAISLIKEADVKGFERYILETGATICGERAIALFLHLANFKKAALEQYYTSGDVFGDYTNSVSYASMVFR